MGLQGGDALAWDNDELTRMRQLHSKDFSDKQVSCTCTTLASHVALAGFLHALTKVELLAGDLTECHIMCGNGVHHLL